MLSKHVLQNITIILNNGSFDSYYARTMCNYCIEESHTTAEMHQKDQVLYKVHLVTFTEHFLDLYGLCLLPSHHRPLVKAPIYFKRNRRINWCDVIRTKSGQNKVRFEFISAVRNSSPKRTYWGSLFWLLNTVDLPLVHGDYAITGWVRETLTSLTCNSFFTDSFLIQRRSGRRTTSPSH